MTDMTNAMPDALHCEGLSLKRSGESFCFDFTLARGELLVLVGPSGAGKSTLLDLLGGFTQADTGSLCWQGQDLRALPPAERPFTTLFQSNNLFDHLTVQQNIGLGARANLRLNPEQWQSVRHAAARLGLEALLERLPPQLSGGQQQRVALARCLVRQRPFLLLDEPFSALDFQTRLILQGDVKRIIREQRKAAILVTHDIGEGIAMSDRVLVLSQRPGTVKAIHDIDLGEATDPGALRRSSAFNEYFDTIWRQLDGHAQATA